jgi:hypothetical protein
MAFTRSDTTMFMRKTLPEKYALYNSEKPFLSQTDVLNYLAKKTAIFGDFAGSLAGASASSFRRLSYKKREADQNESE